MSAFQSLIDISIGVKIKMAKKIRAIVL